jgi:hypothetical protein
MKKIDMELGHDLFAFDIRSIGKVAKILFCQNLKLNFQRTCAILLEVAAAS